MKDIRKSMAANDVEVRPRVRVSCRGHQQVVENVQQLLSHEVQLEKYGHDCHVAHWVWPAVHLCV